MKKVLLVVLDGYGEAPKSEFNAVTNANTPFLDSLREYPHSFLKAHGRAVGVPDDVYGGSEVGHMTMGAGKVVKTMVLKINDDIETGEFANHDAFKTQLTALKNRGGALHIGGLFSDKRIHADVHHAFAIMQVAKMYGIERVFFHAFTDGRDCAINSSFEYLNMFNGQAKLIGVGEIASVGGRFYIMDRENNLERTNLAIDTFQKLSYDFETAEQALKSSHANGVTDEFVKPVRIKTQQTYSFDKNDLFVFYNYRADRMKQPVKELSDRKLMNIITFCDFYKADNVQHLYDEDNVKNGLTEYLCGKGLKVLKVSESTKYAHVTYFFNGGREEPFENEDRVHVITEKTMDYAQTPYMRAKEITDETVKALNKGEHSFILVNYSNPDMIGHTGNYDATVKALEFLDGCVKTLVETAVKNDYSLIITADHGNSEMMRDEKGNPHTAHTLNPVICVCIDKSVKSMLQYGGLRDVAPTVLELMGVENNPSFEGKSLIE